MARRARSVSSVSPSSQLQIVQNPKEKAYMWAIVTSAVYHPYMYIYGKNINVSAD